MTSGHPTDLPRLGGPGPATGAVRRGQTDARRGSLARQHRRGAGPALPDRRALRPVGRLPGLVPRASPAERPGSIRGVHPPATRGGMPEAPARSAASWQALGYRGGKTAARDYVRRLEDEMGMPSSTAPPAPPPRVEVPSARRLAVSVGSRPADRSADDRGHLEALRAGDATIGSAIELAEQFAALIRGRDPGGLADWLTRRELIGRRASLVRPEAATGRGGGAGGVDRRVE